TSPPHNTSLLSFPTRRSSDLLLSYPRHFEVRPLRAGNRDKVALGGSNKSRKLHASVGRQIGSEVVRTAPPLVDRPAPVVPCVVQAAGRDLDQSLVEAGVRALRSEEHTSELQSRGH